MPWMSRGPGETRYVADWEVENMQRSGWRMSFSTTISTDEFYSKEKDGKDFNLTTAQLSFNEGPVFLDTRGPGDPKASVATQAENWGSQFLEDGYRLKQVHSPTTNPETGRLEYRVTYERRGPGLAGLSRIATDVVEKTFVGPKIETSPEEPLFDRDPMAPVNDIYNLQSTGLNNQRMIDDFTERINALANPDGKAAGLYDMIQSGILTEYNADNIAQSVRHILGSENLGDEQRRADLADLVLSEYETSLMGLNSKETIPDPKGDPNPEDDDFLEWLMGQLAGSGGGSSAPQYRPPDRREVEENVRNYLSQVLAQAPEDKVQELADVYMRDHRRSFNNPGLGLSPWFSVKENVHKMEDYQKIHQLRPDTYPEEQWVSQYKEILAEAGVPAGLQPNTQRNFAQTATSLPDALRGAYRQNEVRTGNTQPLFLRNMQSAVSSLARRF